MEQMKTAEALEVAIEPLVEAASNTDTASPEGHRYRLALNTIEQLLSQRGISKAFHSGGGFEPFIDDQLTTLCDILLWDNTAS
jgi:hypothetical protein